MVKILALSVLVLLLALSFVGLGWLLARVQGPSSAVSREDVGSAASQVVAQVNAHVDARADALERKLDDLLNIATNVPPDFRK